MSPKVKYLISSALRLGFSDRKRCPSCHAKQSELVSRKYLVTALRRCSSCDLLFRTPTTTAEENAAFYQEDYSQGFTTDVPTEAELKDLTSRHFTGSEKDYTSYIDVLKALGISPGSKVLDFGCSWGYGSWQIGQAGYTVTSFEISQPRCRYAREKLGIDAYHDLTAIPGDDYDVFFSSHVLEHVPSIADVIEFAKNKLRQGGLFLAFTPNASESFRALHPEAWQLMWGLVHPTLPDDQFYNATFPEVVLASSPYDLSSIKQAWGTNSFPVFPLEGPELMAAVRF